MKKKLFKRSLVALAFVFITILQGSAQNKNRMSVLVENAKRYYSFRTTNVFSVVQYTKVNEFAKEALALKASNTEIAKLMLERNYAIEMEIPMYDGSITKLDLVQSELGDFDVMEKNNSGTSRFDYKSGLHYRGIVKDNNGSIATASIFEDKVIIMFAKEEGTYNLGMLEDNSGNYMLFNCNNLLFANPSTCTTDDNTPYSDINSNQQKNGGPSILTIGCKIVKCYYEADFAMYQAFSSNTTTTANYVTAIFNQKSTLYANDNIGIEISQIVVWTVTDPYASNTSTSTTNNAFIAQTGSSFNGDIANLLSTRSSLGGGIAQGFAGLCNKQNAHCTSLVFTSYSTVPVYSWTVEVITHEMGHLLGSRHTHACVWNGNNTSIDGCAGYVEGSCALLGNPVGGGTIMSYCHQTSVGINFTKGFGPQPAALLVGNIAASSCLTGSNASKPIITANGPLSFCIGGSVTLTSSAASSYLWSTGATTQSIIVSTSLTVSVSVISSSGCTAPPSLVTTVVVNPNPTPVITGNVPICTGGAATLNAGLFTSYSWSTGASTQTISVNTLGTFTVTVTNANGCTGTVSVTTSAFAAPVITGNLTPCIGSSSTLSTGVFNNYLWSTGATTQSIVVSANGTYIVTVTNSAGCTSTATAKVVKKTRPVIAVTPADANLCPPSSSVALTASGNAVTYSWSPATGLNVTTGTVVTASPIATTSYTVTGTSTFGCTTTAAAKITVKPKPVNLTTTNILAASAQTNWTIVDCATGYTVQYRLAGGTWLSVQVNTNIGTRTLTGLQASSNYQWRIKAKYPNGTTGSYTSPVNFTTPALRMGETLTVNALQVYPNPATDKLNIEFPFTEGDATITIVNALGQTVLTQKNNDAEGSIELNIQNLTEGLYFVTVKNGDNIFNSRFVKK